jgi:hypothetical protein
MVDGAARCVSPPWSCDNILCGSGKTCGYMNDKAACFTVWGASGFGMHQPEFPDPASEGPVCVSTYDSSCPDLVVSFPANPPFNLACALLSCNPREYCDWPTGTCKPRFGGGPQN